MFFLDKYRKGRKYNNVFDIFLYEFSDLNKRDEFKENWELNKECEDVKLEFIECLIKVNFLVYVFEKIL